MVNRLAERLGTQEKRPLTGSGLDSATAGSSVSARSGIHHRSRKAHCLRLASADHESRRTKYCSGQGMDPPASRSLVGTDRDVRDVAAVEGVNGTKDTERQSQIVEEPVSWCAPRRVAAPRQVVARGQYAAALTAGHDYDRSGSERTCRPPSSTRSGVTRGVNSGSHFAAAGLIYLREWGSRHCFCRSCLLSRRGVKSWRFRRIQGRAGYCGTRLTLLCSAMSICPWNVGSRVSRAIKLPPNGTCHKFWSARIQGIKL